MRNWAKTPKGIKAKEAAAQKDSDKRCRKIGDETPEIKVEKKEEGDPMDGKNWETHDARKFIKNFHATIPSKVCMVRF